MGNVDAGRFLQCKMTHQERCYDSLVDLHNRLRRCQSDNEPRYALILERIEHPVTQDCADVYPFLADLGKRATDSGEETSPLIFRDKDYFEKELEKHFTWKTRVRIALEPVRWNVDAIFSVGCGIAMTLVSRSRPLPSRVMRGGAFGTGMFGFLTLCDSC